MLKRIWQTCMIGLARNAAMQRVMQHWSASSRLARRYVAGPAASDAVRCADELIRDGIRASMFYLGEYVTTIDLVRQNVANKISVASALGQTQLDVHVSIDPTQIGMLIDRDLARDNAFAIAAKIKAVASSRPGVHCLMLDMEDESVVDWTLRLHDSLQDAGYPVAVTVQAYLRRTELDLFNLVDRGATVRLVRGAFAAKSGTAYTTSADIKANYMRLARLMLSARARATGFYPVFGTHDHVLHQQIVDIAGAGAWEGNQYEFEMLYGARPDVSAQLSRESHRVRLYLPFGENWWPYAMRRIGENPRGAYLLGRAFFAGR